MHSLLILFRFMSMMCMVLNMEWVFVKPSGSDGCCADWETDSFLGSCEGHCFKVQISQGLWCCYQPVNYHPVLSNYLVLVAKLWSFDIGAGGDISLESEAKNRDKKHWMIFLKVLTFLQQEVCTPLRSTNVNKMAKTNSV